jgi:DNA modification methylase
MTDDLNALRHIEGFPVGDDEEILALSDPPYYTAYPNPHIKEFIEKWGKPYDEATDDYQREPYVADVSEGKNDPIYNAHSYHTKVPYRAIVPFVEHYTQPGDIVFDGFCGTGMTGVAARKAGRNTLLCDLSPAAAFIAQNYNAPVDVANFQREAKRIVAEVDAECGWMYETRHSNGRTGRINFVLWSDVFVCPYCSGEVVFWDVAVDLAHQAVRDSFQCPSCKAELTKRSLRPSMAVSLDQALSSQITRVKQLPVLINYSVGTKRYQKRPDDGDFELISRIEAGHIPYWYPSSRMPEGDEARRNDSSGLTHVHHFFQKRELWTLAALWDRIRKAENTRTRSALVMPFTTMLLYCSVMRRFRPDKRGGGPLSGTLYVSSLSTPLNPIVSYERNSSTLREAFAQLCRLTTNAAVTTQSTTSLSQVNEGTMDYVFTDPPFGNNIMYSDLNFLWEAWLQVRTNQSPEAIISNTQRKGLLEYRELMTAAFSEMYRVLKPGRWITVVFHNSKASVWNAIQESLSRAGFIVAQVTVLDKQQGTFKQTTAAGAVKNDLVISAYKLRSGFIQRFISAAGQSLESDFVRQLLEQLPPEANVGRSKEMLYSKYLAYYVQHGYQVAYNGEQFYRVLGQWGFVERDGYWFADEKQANNYERRKAANLGKAKTGQAVLFISDEKSARQWLWDFLDEPKSYGEIYTAFVKALQTPEDQLPEPRVMLEEGFIQTNGEWRRPDAVSQAELERRRQARLLSQFEEYLAAARAGGRLNEVRKEAVVAGFAEAYRAARWQDILAVGRKLPKHLIEDDPDIFDFIDIAKSKAEA